MNKTRTACPFVNSTALGNDMPALRERMREDGYLFLPGLVPVVDVMRVGGAVARLAHEAGWLCTNHVAGEFIANPDGFCVDPEPRYLAVLERVNRLFDFNALAHHPAIRTFIEDFLDNDILVHPKPLLRVLFPGREEYTTPAHQDFPNVQGSESVYTAWIPLMDCDHKCGGLSVARGSHRHGVFDFHIGNGAGGIEITDPLAGQWHAGEMRRGDVLLFHSMTVHRGVPNHGRQLRLSMDCRYQRVSDGFNATNADQPNGAPDNWDEVYADWTDAQRERLAYYWRKLNLRFTSFDRRWFDRRDALGFELGERRDPRARSVLLRIAARDADPDKRQRAERLLRNLPTGI